MLADKNTSLMPVLIVQNNSELNDDLNHKIKVAVTLVFHPILLTKNSPKDSFKILL